MTVQLDVGEGEVADFFTSLHNLYVEGLFCDLQFVIGKERLWAHRCIVACRSPVLGAMLKSPCQEGRSQVVTLPDDTQASHLKILLDFMYGAPCPLTPPEVVPVLELATTYQVSSLITKCSTVLGNALDPHNCCSILMMADSLSLEELRARAQRFVLEEFPSVAQSDVSMELPTRLARGLLASDELSNYDEAMVLKWAVRWVQAKDTRAEDFVRALLPLIRFPLIRDVPKTLDGLSQRFPLLSAPGSPLMPALKATWAASASTEARSRRRTCQLRLSRLIEGHTKAIFALHYFDGRLLSGSWDETLRLWVQEDPGEGSRWKSVQVLTGHTRAILSITACKEQSPADPTRTILSGGAEGVVIRWRSRPDGSLPFVEQDRKQLASGAVLVLTWAQELGLLLCGCRDGDAHVLDGRTLETMYKLEGHDGAIYAIKLLGASACVTGANDGCMKMWSLSPDARPPSKRCRSTIVAHAQPIYCLAVLNDHCIMSGSYDRTIKIWSAASAGDAMADMYGVPTTWSVESTFQLHQDAVSEIIPANTDVVVAGGWDGAVYSISPHGSSPPAKVDQRPGRVLALVYDPESSVVAAGVNDGTIALYV